MRISRSGGNVATEKLFETVVGRDADEAPPGRHEPRNWLIHVVTLTFTKVADGLIDPKLVLAWLLNALGAPGAFIGAVVPVREAGALLPQLALTRWVETRRRRKTIWSLGSALQGLAALGMAASAVLLDGWIAGLAVVACLAGLAVARAICSLSHKDAVARTIRKTRRGSVGGTAASLGSAAVLAFGGALAGGLIPLAPWAIGAALAVAGGLWIGAAGMFLLLSETGRDPQPAAGSAAERFTGPLRRDPQFRRFVAVRALLTATALAPPFLVMLSSEGGARQLGYLGPLVLASAGASILSGYVWGRLSDRSSRQTLMASGALGAMALGAAAAAGLATGGLGGVAGSVLAIFAAQIAYAGVRTGRKVHLTDMVADDRRARYTALSNSLIGTVLLAGGLFGVLADLAGPAWVLAAFAALCAGSVPVAASLDEVQTPRDA